MGKKSRNKHHAPTLASKNKRKQPDDYFRNGPFEIARFGKHVVMHKNMTHQQHKKWLEYLAKDLPKVTCEIDNCVSNIVRIVQCYDPLSLLQRGYWTSVLPYISSSNTSKKSPDAVSQRMIDYIQSVIASTPPKITPAPPVTDEAWNELTHEVESLFSTINHQYITCRVADWTVNGNGPPDDKIDFYVRALSMWCNVTGDRYHFQEISYLRDLVTPHSEILEKLWGIDAEQLLHGLERILNSLTRGIGEAIETMHIAYEKYISLQEATDLGEDELGHQLDQLRQNDAIQTAFRRLFGSDLFEIDQYLPSELLKALSWEPGQCQNFIDQHPQSGWPTRIWPRSQRPFLKIENSHYCFDLHSLFDHIYRVLQRTICAQAPSYKETWNKRQKETSEALPFKLFSKILPDATSWQSVHYEIDEVDSYGHTKWCELDGLLAYEDHLFIIEVKAGSFTATSPETDIESHIKSIERLIFSPVDQGLRFRNWFEKNETVTLYDAQHEIVGKIKRSDFIHITVCAISLDTLTELSAKAYHLRKLTGRNNNQPFWALSISDLLSYSDLFENPLIFLHFVEKRNQATTSSKVVLDDELDHYGMYLLHNNYDLHANDIAGKIPIHWTGYRDIIDQYFDAKIREEPAILPSQEIPPLYFSIVQTLGKTRCQNRRAIASLLLDNSGQMRRDIESKLHATLTLQARYHRLQPLTISGAETRITFVCWTSGTIDFFKHDLTSHCKTAMIAAKEPNRWLIELYFDSDHNLHRVEPKLFNAQDISESEMSRLSTSVQQLVEQRFKRAVSKGGKIGRNQLCPCGSGKKNKRCCKI